MIRVHDGGRRGGSHRQTEDENILAHIVAQHPQLTGDVVPLADAELKDVLCIFMPTTSYDGSDILHQKSFIQKMGLLYQR